jgi:2-iminobutanoate/2-iminopropanoate deaminase
MPRPKQHGDPMEKKSRRGLLTKGATAAVAAAAALTATGADAKTKAAPKLVKRSPYPPRDPSAGKPMFSRGVAYGNMLFISGIGYHKEGDIAVHTRGVLDEMSQALKDAGSSLQQCLKVTVLLADLKDYAAMNEVYKSYDWGDVPPVRTTTSVAGVPGNSLVEIDVIAYI